MRWRFPKPSRPIPTDQGVASRRRRGAFVESWWAERWIRSLEELMDPGRLGRGRRYARAGQVLSLDEVSGEVIAQVQGSRRTPYTVTIGLKPLSDAAWERVIAALARRADLAAALLAGEMPPGIDEVFSKAKASLFPTAPSHLRLACTCPDWVTVCKHVAATCYLLGEQFDEDPFLLFRLRGRDQDALLEGLRRRAGRAAGSADAAGDTAAGAADAAAVDGSAKDTSAADTSAKDAASTTGHEGGSGPASAPLGVDGFWTAADEVPEVDLPAERPDLALLRRLGPFSALDEGLLERLGPVYRTVAGAADARLEEDEGDHVHADDASLDEGGPDGAA